MLGPVQGPNTHSLGHGHGSRRWASAGRGHSGGRGPLLVVVVVATAAAAATTTTAPTVVRASARASAIAALATRAAATGATLATTTTIIITGQSLSRRLVSEEPRTKNGRPYLRQASCQNCEHV